MWGGERENLNKTWLYYISEQIFCLLLSKLSFEIIPDTKTDPKLDTHQLSSRNKKEAYKMWNNNCCFISSLVRNTDGFFLLDNFRVQINNSKSRLENFDKEALTFWRPLPPAYRNTCIHTHVVYAGEMKPCLVFCYYKHLVMEPFFCQVVPPRPLQFPSLNGRFYFPPWIQVHTDTSHPSFFRQNLTFLFFLLVSCFCVENPSKG